MPKFDSKYPDILSGKIIELNKSIETILNKQGKLSTREIAKLEKLYFSRKEILDKLLKLMNSEPAKEYLEIFSKEWRQTADLLIKGDDRLIDKIKSRVVELKTDLQNLNKSKSLLIYSKEK